jgi:hypothetical protein
MKNCNDPLGKETRDRPLVANCPNQLRYRVLGSSKTSADFFHIAFSHILKE